MNSLCLIIEIKVGLIQRLQKNLYSLFKLGQYHKPTDESNDY